MPVRQHAVTRTTRYNRFMVSEPSIILASESLRRREIIGALDAGVEIVPPGIDEPRPRHGDSAEEYVASTASGKARCVAAAERPGAIVIGADTSVVLDERILGKPENADEARMMLKSLRGRSHRVVTGVTVTRDDATASSVTASDVVMRDYSDVEIEEYIDSGEPFDKAGGYAIQDRGFAPVSALRGCYLNVVGFPLCEVIRLMSEFDVGVGLKPGWRAPERCPSDCPVGIANEVAIT